MQDLYNRYAAGGIATSAATLGVSLSTIEQGLRIAIVVVGFAHAVALFWWAIKDRREKRGEK